MIEVKNVQKSIEGNMILQDISFTIQKGSIVGILGRNGAGKTTLLRTLVGTLLPDEGTVSYDDFDIMTHPEIKERVVFVPDSTAVISQYRVKELVSFYQAVYSDFDENLFQQLMERYKLPNGKIRSYSKGMKALLAIILAFCTKAEYIILDEPTNGLDPIIKRQMLQFIIEEVSNNHTTVLISTHHLDAVEKIADTIIMIKDNSIESITQLEDARKQFYKIQVAFEKTMPKKLEILANIKILHQVGKVYTILINGNVEATLAKFQKEYPVLLEELPMSLEDIFVTTLGGDDYVS